MPGHLSLLYSGILDTDPTSPHSSIILLNLFFKFLFNLFFKVLKICSTCARWGEYSGIKQSLYPQLAINSWTRCYWWEDQLSKIIKTSFSGNMSDFSTQLHRTIRNWKNRMESIVFCVVRAIHAPFENIAMIQFILPTSEMFFHSIVLLLKPQL